MFINLLIYYIFFILIKLLFLALVFHQQLQRYLFTPLLFYSLPLFFIYYDYLLLLLLVLLLLLLLSLLSLHVSSIYIIPPLTLLFNKIVFPFLPPPVFS